MRASFKPKETVVAKVARLERELVEERAAARRRLDGALVGVARHAALNRAEARALSQTSSSVLGAALACVASHVDSHDDPVAAELSLLGRVLAGARGMGDGSDLTDGLGDGLAGSLAIANKSLAGAARGAELFGAALG